LNDGVVWVFDNPNVNVYLSFEINVTAPRLRGINYSSYQHELYELCKKMRDEGKTLPYIANWLTENGYKSARGKVLKNPHIHSILKKKKLADERISERFIPNIENMRLTLKRKSHRGF